MNIGYDLGRTIKGPTKEQYNDEMPGAFDVISKLTKKFNKSYIVPRVNSEQRERAINWLNNKNFYNITGIPENNIYYCFDRRDKALFIKALDIRVFIDDRPTVLSPMGDDVLKILFNPWAGDLEKYKDEIMSMKNLVIVNNWKQIGEYFKV